MKEKRVISQSSKRSHTHRCVPLTSARCLCCSVGFKQGIMSRWLGHHFDIKPALKSLPPYLPWPDPVTECISPRHTISNGYTVETTLRYSKGRIYVTLLLQFHNSQNESSFHCLVKCWWNFCFLKTFSKEKELGGTGDGGGGGRHPQLREGLFWTVWVFVERSNTTDIRQRPQSLFLSVLDVISQMTAAW